MTNPPNPKKKSQVLETKNHRTPKFLKKLKSNPYIEFSTALVRNWARVEMSMRAGGLAFITILSLIPLLALSLSTFKHVGGVESALEMIETLIRQYLVFGTHSLLMDKIREFVGRVNAESLGIFGLAFACLTSARMFVQFDQSVQRIWGYGSEKGWVRLLFFFIFLFLAPLTFAIFMGWISSFALKESKWVIQFWPSSRITGFFMLFVPVFSLIKWMPSKRVMWRVAFTAAIITVLALIGAKQLYVWATVNLFSYSQIYGSLAAFPLFLLWVYILWSIILFGFVFCAVGQSMLLKTRGS